MKPARPPDTPGTPDTLLQQAIAAYRRGDVAQALALSGQQATLAPADFSAHTVHGEVLHRAGRVAELQAFLQAHPAFAADARGLLLQARAARRLGDLATAEQALRRVQAMAAAAPLQRMAGFELSEVLALQGRHAAAWDLVQATHDRSTRPFPVATLVQALRITAQAPREELAALPRATRTAARTAVILGLPRSGTTLLEQMLDAHPQVHGLGELPWAGEMANAIAREGGGWPVGAQRVKRATLDQLQARYARETRGRLRLPADMWTLDKTVFPMMQPLFINAVLPGARVLHLVRGARDNAASIFLNNFDPTWGWTSALARIQQVIAAEREFVPVILDKLKLQVLRLHLEDLVQAPEPTMKRVLAHLGLPWHDACLQPQLNPRLVHTLSFEQVRQPLNRHGIGRWRQHAERFGSDWDVLDPA